MTATTKSSKTDAVTMSRMNFSGYVGHVTISACERSVSGKLSERERSGERESRKWS